ncbi:hypothetical protein JCM10207_009264 [Rhodosporidiobolus poonsookiae]
MFRLSSLLRALDSAMSLPSHHQSRPSRSYSPTIRKPSLFQRTSSFYSSSSPSSSSRFPSTTSQRRRRLTPALPLRLVTLLRFALVLAVLYVDHFSFLLSASPLFGGCTFDDRPSLSGQVWAGSALSGQGAWVPDSRWRLAHQSHSPDGQPFHVLVAADPQLLDLRSYPGRPWVLRKLGVWVTDLYARRAWSAVSTRTRGSAGGGVDGVVWLGDLLDNGLQAVEQREYASLVHRFHLLFPLPRLSSSSSLSSSPHSHLTPPIPSIVLPGNHDLGLSPSSPSSSSPTPPSSLASYRRERFSDAFGPPYGEREWGGWRVVWVDAMALLEDEFWTEGGGRYGAMKAWLEDMGRESRTLPPRLLLTHIPLFRPEGTSCGSLRESSRPIRQGRGEGYQNELGERETRWVMERVWPVAVYSGDDHDACTIQHPYVSPLDGVSPVTETTVKAFSIAMGISTPGYVLLSLYPPLPPPPSSPGDPPDPDAQPSYTLTQRACALPNLLGLYIRVYAALAFVAVAGLSLPKLAVGARRAVQRARAPRRAGSARANGVPVSSSAAAGGEAGAGGAGHGRSLSGTILALAGAGGGRGGRRRSAEDDVEDAEAAYPGLLGGLTHAGGAGGGGGGGYELFDAAAEVDEGLSDADDAGLPQPVSGASGHGRGKSHGHVRRVSRVWLWEGSGRPPSSSSSSSLSTRRAPTSALDRTLLLFERLAARLAANSLLSPLFRLLLRPLSRAARLAWLRASLPLVLLGQATGGVLDRAGLVGQVVRETAEEVWELAGPAVGAWVGVGVWWSL